VKRLAYSRSALKALSRLPDEIRADLKGKLARFVETGAGDVKRLTGRPGWRLRSGDYRLIFEDSGDTILVHAVGHRREIYR
jgi:mRNA interferase RelE/StbE